MNQYIPPSCTIEGISMALGRPVPSSEQGNRDYFLDFTEVDISDFRLLGRNFGLYAVSYIRFRLKGVASLQAVKSYYSSVIQNEMPVEEWIRKGYDKI